MVRKILDSNEHNRNMASQYDVIVVIPTLNEEDGIGWVLKRVHNIMNKINKRYHIVVVDGGSDDDTIKIARKKGAEVILQKGRGYGDAYLQGFKYVVKKYRPNIIIMIDGDGTYDPVEMKNMIKKIEQGLADMVIGNRFAGIKSDAMSKLNVIGNKILSWLTRVLTGINIKDTQSGFRAMSRELIERILPLINQKGMPFASEILIVAHANGYKIIEVPISYNSRKGGESKLNPFVDGYKILKTTIILSFRYKFKRFIIILTLTIIITILVLLLGIGLTISL